MTEFILLIITIGLIASFWLPSNYLKRIIIISMAISLCLTTYHNLFYHPHYQVWLCNFTALFSLILGIKYYQWLFNIVFYFAWTGDIFTFIVPDNQTLPDINQYPITWVAYWLKHITPLLFTIWIIRFEGRKLTGNGIYQGLAAMTIYTVLMVGYNFLFHQNILDLQYPTVDIENAFGKWPWYILVNMTILVLWYFLIHLIGRKIKIVS